MRPICRWCISATAKQVRVGQFAFAIGAPFRLDYTFTSGVISGKGRSKLIDNAGYSISDYLQTDASINPGNSGGPLCDIDGNVVGMNTLINGLNRGLGFAIPSNLVRGIGEQLVAGHKIVRPWLGIRIETLGDDPLHPRFVQGRRSRRGRAHDRSRCARLQKRAATIRCHHRGSTRRRSAPIRNCSAKS